MAEPILYPIVKIRPPLGSPSHPAYSLFSSSAQKVEESRASGGLRNVIPYYLDNREPDSSDDFENDHAYKIALSLPYSLTPTDEFAGLGAWETVVTPREKEQLDAQRIKYTALRDELVAKQAALPAGQSLSEEDEEKLASYREAVDSSGLALGIAGNRIGFLEEIPDMFGYGGISLHDLNGVPNVEKIRRSVFSLSANRPFHLALRFSEPAEGQRETSFKTKWGPFTLEWRGGRRVYLTMYSYSVFGRGEEANLKAIAKKEQLLEFLYDQERITAEDADYISEREILKRKLRADIKKQKLKKADQAYKDINRQIHLAQSQIDARRKLKRAAPGETRRQIDDIQKSIYQIYDQPVNLSESAENFYGDEGICRLTVLPQARGYITFVLTGKEPVTVKIPEILKSKKYRNLWEDTRIAFFSNGGAFDWKFLYPTVASQGEYIIPAQELPFTISEGDVVYFTTDADTTGAGTQVYSEIRPVADFNEFAPAYDFVVVFRSDVPFIEDSNNIRDIRNSYLPWLYSENVRIEAGEVPDNSEILWDSQRFVLYPQYPRPDRDCPIADVTFTADAPGDSQRGVFLTIDIKDPNGTIQFPKNGYYRHALDFSVGLWTKELGVYGVEDVLKEGVIREAVLMDVKWVGEVDEMGEPVSGEGQFVDIPATTHTSTSFWRLSVGDLLSTLDDYELREDLVLDGLTLGAALRILARARGLRSSSLTGIPVSGIAAGPKLPVAGPGQRPAKAIRKGVNLGPAMRQLVEQFGVRDDDIELRLHAHSGVVTLDDALAFDFEYSGDRLKSGSKRVMWGAQRVQDWTQFFNSFYIEGAKDPVTKQKVSRSIILYESIDNPESVIYVGEEKRFNLIQRPDLQEEDEVERAVEIAAIRNSKSGDMRQFDSWWIYPKIPIIGDTFLVDGQRVEIIRLGMKFKSDSRATVTVRPVREFTY